MPAHVASPFYRRFWGIFKTGQLESLGLNWSPEHPGIMVLPPFRNTQTLARVAAHEFGHLLGIGDAYGAIYRLYANAPNTDHYMMNSNGSVQAQEIQMMIQAHESRRMQYFPKHFQWLKFKLGLKRDIHRQIILMSNHFNKLIRSVKRSNR